MAVNKIEGVERVLAKLQAMKNKNTNVTVLVGYTASYAVYVHENTEMKLAGQKRRGGKGRYWDPQGKAGPKFLEGPAREMQEEIGQITAKAVKSGATLEQALLMAGLRLQRESQKRVPVDTGNLKASAFTRKE